MMWCVATPRQLTSSDRCAVRAAALDALIRVDEQIASLTRIFDDIVEAALLVSTDDEHDPEGSTIAFERSQVSSLLREARADKKALQQTFDRVEDTTFGICERCHGFIGVERLLALPVTTRCVECAR